MTATQTTLNAPQSRTLLVITAFITFILLGLPAGMLGVAWPSIRDGFQVSQESVGALLLASRLGYLLSSGLSGPAATRLGTGGLLLLGAGSFCLGLVGYASAPTWLVMVLVGGLLGAGGGALDGGMNAFFALNFGPRLMNWLHASFGVGATLGPALLTVILVNGGSWRLGYWIVAGALAGLTVFYGLTLSHWRTHLPPGEGGQENQTRGGVSLVRLGVLLSILIFLMSAGLEGATGQWSFSLFTESRGVPVAIAGMWVSIYWG
ncbi:MAG: MFS transporter, partial [Caldilineae bacterium]